MFPRYEVLEVFLFYFLIKSRSVLSHLVEFRNVCLYDDRDIWKSRLKGKRQWLTQAKKIQPEYKKVHF